MCPNCALDFRMSKMNKSGRTIVTESIAKQRLAAYSIELIEWGGKVISRSKFKNLVTSKEFTDSYAQLMTRLRVVPIERIGAGRGGTKKANSRRARAPQYVDRLQELGLSNISQLPEIKEKKKETCLKNWGASTNLKVDSQKEKIKETNIKKYGSTCSLHGGVGLEKKLATWGDKGHPGARPEAHEKTKLTRIALGLTKEVDGKTMSELAGELGVAYSTLQNTVKYEGIDAALLLKPRTSHYESLIHSWFPGATHNKKLTSTSYRPDFVWETEKLIVEVDGIFWHSDAIQPNKRYHANKKEAYAKVGYKSLFFRTDEVIARPEVVKSMISYHLGKATKVHARKCVVTTTGKNFFDVNHLMGTGRGSIFALEHQGEIVSAIQVYWAKKDKVLEISRFCNKTHTTVVGGYSKLLAHVVKALNPTQIHTFVDLRYGDRIGIENLGFRHVRTQLSFAWVVGHATVHRMQYPGNSGTELGYPKIWDCGQAAFEKDFKQT